MRKKVFSIAPWIVGCAILALPVAAEEGSAGGGIFQDLFEAVAIWFASTDDLPDPAIPATGHPNGDEPELGPYTMPGGLTAPGDPTWVSPHVPPGGNPISGYTPEMWPISLPGG